MKNLFVAAVVAGLVCGFSALAAGDAAPAPATVNKPAEPVTLPKDIVWTTDNDEPLIGSPKALRGGTLRLALGAYPLTLRLVGPNSNDFFAAWNRSFTIGFTLVTMHPVTDKFIPMMATDWSVQPDQKTIYFKLDRDARWSDGKPITADDYVFTWKMLKSKYIVDPFYNTYMQQYYQSVDKIDDYTLRIVGTRKSWRPLYDYAGFWPTPAHATVLDDTWVTRTNNVPPVAVGPYVISDMQTGQSITFKRIEHWWGDNKRYFIGQYNFDQIQLTVITQERELDYVRLGQLDAMIEGSAREWHEGFDFPAAENGWLRRARVFVDVPEGINGLQMNLGDPLFANRDFRLAMQYLLDFNRLNQNLLYGDYFRINTFFQGTEFANPNVHAYPFDPEQARLHLLKAGFHRPKSMQANNWLAQLENVAYGLLFTRSDTDDVLVNDRGDRASFTLLYDSKAFDTILSSIQQDYRRAGVDMRLQMLEPGTMFERALQRKFEMLQVAMSSALYPDPRQNLGSEFKTTTNNNDFWGFGTPEVDALIKTYEESFDPEARKKALYRIDQIVHDEAFYIPFWTAPYVRLVYWDYMQFPECYLPKRASSLTDYFVYWIDPAKKAALTEAMQNGTAYPQNKVVDVDCYGVQKKLQ
ncbi:MAG: ABC transporter substrate-binding protein [Alphaproteobacteria bacterium]|nr:ABC transporter substrate-binding protein [Alphaproteobacteria bacterium]